MELGPNANLLLSGPRSDTSFVANPLFESGFPTELFNRVAGSDLVFKHRLPAPGDSPSHNADRNDRRWLAANNHRSHKQNESLHCDRLHRAPRRPVISGCVGVCESKRVQTGPRHDRKCRRSASLRKMSWRTLPRAIT